MVVELPLDQEVFPLDKREFRDWLEDGDPDRVVGLANRAGDCPLARYLKEKYGYNFVVGYGTTRVVTDEFPLCTKYWSVPEWAKEFAKTVDRRVDFSVTARTAIRILTGELA